MGIHIYFWFTLYIFKLEFQHNSNFHSYVFRLELNEEEFTEMNRVTMGPEELSRLMSLELRIHLSSFVATDHIIKMISNDVKSGKAVRCLVGRIVHPGEFWVIPLQLNDALEAMMTAMQ